MRGDQSTHATPSSRMSSSPTPAIPSMRVISCTELNGLCAGNSTISAARSGPMWMIATSSSAVARLMSIHGGIVTVSWMVSRSRCHRAARLGPRGRPRPRFHPPAPTAVDLAAGGLLHLDHGPPVTLFIRLDDCSVNAAPSSPVHGHQVAPPLRRVPPGPSDRDRLTPNDRVPVDR
jgi:hypothetical protein